MPIFDVVELPFCKVLRVGAWNEPAHRYFLAYRAESNFRHVLGLPVVDEFATFSSPIFFAPPELMGKIYNAGISLGHKRDPEMAIDFGWPPIVVGCEGLSAELPPDWELTLLAEVQKSEGAGVQRSKEAEVQKVRIGATEIFATSAPLLPRQLLRVCDSLTAPFRIAFATGNRIVRSGEASPLDIRAVSESVLQALMGRES